METEVLIKTLIFILTCFVNVKDSPLLMVTLVVAPDSYCMSFFILSSLDIKDLVILPVDELFILILEDLPPSRVSAPDLKVVSSSTALDVPRLVVESSLDGH
jgi:hypothetical protein